MNINTFLNNLKLEGEKIVLTSAGGSYSYADLTSRINDYVKLLRETSVNNCPVLLVSDYNLNSIAMLFALWGNNNVVGITQPNSEMQTTIRAEAVGCRYLIDVSDSDNIQIHHRTSDATSPAIAHLLASDQPGFVIFSSGTTGTPKGVVHRLLPFLQQYAAMEACGTILAFLSFDHIGGLVTVLQALATQGTLVIPNERSPSEVSRCIDQFAIETLHVSPTLLKLVSSSPSFLQLDTSHLRRIYFGSEPISPGLVAQIALLLPGVKLQQFYGMSEIGVLPCISQMPDKSWFTINDPAYQLRAVNGILQVKGPTNMIDYLQGDSAVTHDGYFITGDLVVQDGSHFQVTGRTDDIINVGGTKVQPFRVESAILEVDNIIDVVVYGRENPLLGQIVAAQCYLAQPESLDSLKARIYQHVKDILIPVQIPRFLSISEKPLHSNRFKKVRHPDAPHVS